jgi:hypothetical protein
MTEVAFWPLEASLGHSVSPAEPTFTWVIVLSHSRSILCGFVPHL